LGEIKNDDLAIVGVNADMKLAPGSSFRRSLFFEQLFARSAKLQSGAVNDQMQLACSRTRLALNRQPTLSAAERRMTGNWKVDR